MGVTIIVSVMVIAAIAALFLIVTVLSGSLRAEDAKPLATVEELTAKAAEQQKEIAKLNEQLMKLNQKLTIYQQSAFRCQDAMLDVQIDAQAKHATPNPKPYPESGQK